MNQKSKFIVTILLTLLIAWQSLAGKPNACDLVTKEAVEKASGLIITNVLSKDEGVFSSCTYETENWQVSVGLIYFPEIKSDMNSTMLSEELQKEFDSDKAPYTKPVPLADLGNAAAYYQSVDGDFHAIVILSSSSKVNGRLIVTAPTHLAALSVAKLALDGD